MKIALLLIACSLIAPAIGAVAGAVIDAHGNGDATYPATLGLAYFGAIVGLPVGALVGAIWPVK